MAVQSWTRECPEKGYKGGEGLRGEDIQAVTGEVQAGHKAEILHRDGGHTLERAPQGCSHGTKPVRV